MPPGKSIILYEEETEKNRVSGQPGATTVPVKPLSHDRLYYFLPYWDEKPTVYIRSGFPDHRRRMYNSNAITKIADKVVRNHAQVIENFSHFDEGLENTLKF